MYIYIHIHVHLMIHNGCFKKMRDPKIPSGMKLNYTNHTNHVSQRENHGIMIVVRSQ